MNEQDKKDFSKAERRIYDLMKDGRWYSATEIIAASGQREGLRRLRNLRNRYEVQMVRISTAREFMYRLVPLEAVQLQLFREAV